MSTEIFGNWILSSNVANLNASFCTASPYEHVIIPNFFQEDVATALHASFPDPMVANTQHDWKHYDNPIEQKYTLNDFQNLPIVKKTFDLLQSEAVVDAITAITGIAGLESDPYFHGAGIHAYPRRGKLDMHLDYSIHPISKKERRVNLIIYLNPSWKEEYGGHLELWDASMKEHTKVIAPSWNTAVLFRTNNISFHGLPRPIQCPVGDYRKSLAIYYVSEPTPAAKPRYKAEFFPYPNQPVNASLARLYDIRKHRVLTAADLEDWPTWRDEGQIHGFW